MESLVGIKSLLRLILEGLSSLILIRAVMSWFIGTRNSRFNFYLAKITDPILVPIQRLIPPFSGIDISPIVALLLIQLIDAWILS